MVSNHFAKKNDVALLPQTVPINLLLIFTTETVHNFVCEKLNMFFIWGWIWPYVCFNTASSENSTHGGQSKEERIECFIFSLYS